jgi:2'-5' RNA ligase
MSPIFSRYFIALLPPLHIQDYANEVKQHFIDKYASSGASNSPPHITLKSPFEWLNTNVALLEEDLAKFASNRKAIPITLKGFAAFEPRVIYIDVLKTQELMTLQSELIEHLESNLDISDNISKKRSFTPHMTVAFKDLTRQNFQAAWLEFERQDLHFEFTTKNITLLFNNSNKWDVKSEFDFGNC